MHAHYDFTTFTQVRARLHWMHVPYGGRGYYSYRGLLQWQDTGFLHLLLHLFK